MLDLQTRIAQLKRPQLLARVARLVSMIIAGACIYAGYWAARDCQNMAMP